jgi:hypothetical protein
MPSDDFTSLLEKLCAASRDDFANPYKDFEWPERLEDDAWHMSPELVSLHGTEIWESLDEATRRRLAFFEAVNFFSLNIHGERALVEGLSHRLYQNDQDGISAYLHHFLDEENKHMVYFGGFCLRYAGKIYPDRTIAFPREFAPGEEEFLFFARVMVFEEIVDVYNVRMARDQRMSAVTRRINELHHRDETRHLAFGRRLVPRLFERHAPGWSEETLAGVRASLGEYLLSTWKSYYNPEAYRDAGLTDAMALREAAFDHPRCRAHRAQVTTACLRYLLENRILDAEPAL